MMTILKKLSTLQLMFISFAGAVFILYPDIACIPWYLNFLKGTERQSFLWVMAFRGMYFIALIFLLMWMNLHRMNISSFWKRLGYNTLTILVAFGLCLAVSLLYFPKAIHVAISILLFQFIVICVLSTLTGHIYHLLSVQRKKELEIEQLKIENLQSRCDALANQINPHFFFNSLNGLASLIRKKNDVNTLAYVNKLSDVFRYILQSDKKRLVVLEEELDFLQSFRHTMEVRFANKLEFDIEILPEMLSCKLPVLSILPLIDNVVVHNMIDSDHKMVVTIRVNEHKELVISNPVYPKLLPPETNGTGLKNLKNRFFLLMNRKIRIEDSGDMFRVYLPLNEYSDESIDC
jgi:sensor histidine kinase YesM